MSSIQLKTAVPGPKSQALMERRKRVVSSGVGIGKAGIFAESACGALLIDVDGNQFLDFTGGIGCVNAGHSTDSIVTAAVNQAQKLQHTCFQVTGYESYLALAEKLAAIVPVAGEKKVALFNSGAEAVENAIKIARRFTGRQGVVCFENAFHGRTLLTLTATSKVKPYKDGFGPFAPEVYQAPYPYMYRRPRGLSEEQYTDDCIARLHQFFKATVVPERVAAVIIEPIMGEGGFLVPPKRFMTELAKLCQSTGMLLIADEIQAGFARSGKMFGCEHFGWKPDLMTLAKSMSNGFPVSAVVGRADVMDSVQAGGLGGTFGGNPVASAAALATIEYIEKQKLAERANRIGETVKARFAKPKGCVGEVRGLGAMIGIEIVKPGTADPDKDRAEKITVECAKRGLLILTAGVDGNIIRTLMPLVISDEQLDEALNILEEVLNSV